MTRRRWWPGSLALAIAFACAAPAAAQVPAPGRYDAQLCVANPASEPPRCGDAELVVESARRARVRVADIVYRLRLRSSQLDVTTMHGAMQIDGFGADFAWEGGALVFTDAEKNVRYEIRPQLLPAARPR